MSTDKPCARCKGPTPTNDNLAESTFWGFVETRVVTTTIRVAHLRATYFRRATSGSPVLRVDEEAAFCSDCWGDLVGRFMQGRSVDALPGKVDR